jgi:hypothetical protein
VLITFNLEKQLETFVLDATRAILGPTGEAVPVSPDAEDCFLLRPKDSEEVKACVTNDSLVLDSTLNLRFKRQTSGHPASGNH